MSKSTIKLSADSYVHVLSDEVGGSFAFKARTPEEVKCWQRDFRPRLREVLGLGKIESRGRCALEAKQIDEEIFDTYVRQEWTIQSEPGFELPFYLLCPKTSENHLPLVITPHGHNKTGKKLYVGICENENEQNEMIEGQRDIALQAVKAGYVVIAPDMRGLASLRREQDIDEDNAKSCPEMQMHALMFGRTLIGERVWDIERLIDFAQARDDIDTSKIAITGTSGGGTVSIYAAACDERISVCVPSSSFATFEGSIGSIRHCECNYVPGIMTLGEIYDVAGLITPRPFLAVVGKYDDIFPIEYVEEAFTRLKHMYNIAGNSELCELFVGEGGHRYYKERVWEFVKKAFDDCSTHVNKGKS